LLKTDGATGKKGSRGKSKKRKHTEKTSTHRARSKVFTSIMPQQKSKGRGKTTHRRRKGSQRDRGNSVRQFAKNHLASQQVGKVGEPEDPSQKGQVGRRLRRTGEALENLNGAARKLDREEGLRDHLTRKREATLPRVERRRGSSLAASLGVVTGRKVRLLHRGHPLCRK